MQSIDVVTSQIEEASPTLPAVDDYRQRNVSKEVLRVVMSYADCVNRIAWHKYE